MHWPSSTSSLLGSFVRDWKSFDDLRRRGCGELLDVLLDLFPKFISVRT